MVDSKAETSTLVSVLIVAYNSADELATCLRSLAASTTRPYEVVVVDNASSDESSAIIRNEFPDVRLIVNDQNVGFGAAVNQAARAARGDFLVLLNPDTTVRSGCIEALLDVATRRPRGGLYGGRCVTDDGGLEPSSCWGPPTLWSDICFATGLSAALRGNRVFDPQSYGRWQRDSEREVGVITGCLLLATREVWEKLGGFDETYWLYGEDTDLCDRARAAGYTPLITPDAEVVHNIGGSASDQGWRMARILQGKVTFQRRRRSPSYARVSIFLLLVGVRLRSSRVLSRLPGRSQESSVWLTAWNERHSWLTGYPGVE